MFILTVLMLASLSLVLTNTRPARADQDSKAALAAAQAGIDEYISRLTSTNGQYWTNAGVDATTPAMDPNPATPQCEGGGRTIPGAGTSAARFCYRVMTPTTETAKFGYIKLQVTGTSQPYAGARSVSRTLSTTLRPDGFIDFIYYTDVEVLDPVLLGDNVTSCSKHYYEGRGSGCTEIQWGPNDVIDGPMHSNDALQVGGSVWFKNQRTESSWDKANKTKLWWGSGTPKTGAGAYWPIYKPTVPIPPGNEALLKYVQPKIDTDPNTDRPGCGHRDRGGRPRGLPARQQGVASGSEAERAQRNQDPGAAGHGRCSSSAMSVARSARMSASVGRYMPNRCAMNSPSVAVWMVMATPWGMPSAISSYLS